MSPDEISQIINAYFANMAAMNTQGWLDNFAPDAIINDPVGDPPKKAHEDSQKFFELLSMIFAKLELSQDHVFIAGNGAAVKWTMRGYAKNGKQGIAEGISIFELNESGKLQQVSSYWDEAKMMQQLKD